MMKITMPFKQPGKKPGSRRMRRPGERKLKLRASTKQAIHDDDFDDELEEYEEPTMRLSQAFIVVLILHIFFVGGIFTFNLMKTRHVTTAPESKPMPSSEQVRASTSAVETVASKKEIASTSSKTAPIPLSRPANGIYEVQTGDTLTRIAGVYGVSIASLQTENGLGSESHIRPGQRLKIPVEKGSSAQVKAVPASKTLIQPTATTTASRTEISDKVVTANKEVPKVVEPTTTKSAAPVVSTGEKSANTYVVAKGDNPYSIAKKFKVSYTKLLEVNAITDPTKLQIGQELTIPGGN